MKLSRILNEIWDRWPDFHIKTTKYQGYDHWAAYEFDIPGPIDLDPIPIKIKNIGIIPDLDDSMKPKLQFENPLDNIEDEFEANEEVISYKIYGGFSKLDEPFAFRDRRGVNRSATGPLRWGAYQSFRGELRYDTYDGDLVIEDFMPNIRVESPPGWFSIKTGKWHRGELTPLLWRGSKKHHNVQDHILSKVVHPVIQKHYEKHQGFYR